MNKLKQTKGNDVLTTTTPKAKDKPPRIPCEEVAFLRSALKLNHMKMIVALDESAQISAAASVLNISQPAASRMLSEMEEALDAPLCERLPRGIVLTPYGKVFARRARAILLELREVDREIHDLKTGKGGSVFLGAVTAPAIQLAVPAITRIRERFPKIEINIQVEASSVLARELLAARHDFIIGRIPDDLNPRLFKSKVIGTEKACLIVRRGHPLAGKGPVELQALTGFDWVLQPRGSPLRQTIEAMFLCRDISLPERILNTTSVLLTLVMVAQTDAVAPISYEVGKFIAGADGLAGAIDILPTPFDLNVLPYSLLSARNRTLSPAAKLLYDYICEELK
jgi:DNA-binding transcriptional LysR family regulator